MLHTCMVLDLAPSECLYVGDHVRDIQAGNAAGMDTATALWGYIADHEQAEQWDANFLLNTPNGLLELIKEKHSKAWSLTRLSTSLRRWERGWNLTNNDTGMVLTTHTMH